MRRDIARVLLGVAIGVTGLIVILIYGGWQVGLGAWLMIWGNNLERSVKL